MIGEGYKGWKNEFIGIFGGTGSGKTSFCLNVLALWAGEQGTKKDSTVVFISATANFFFDMMKRSGDIAEDRFYYMERDYSNISQVNFYKKKDLRFIIDDTLRKDNTAKILVFLSDIKRMGDMEKFIRVKRNIIFQRIRRKFLRH